MLRLHDVHIGDVTLYCFSYRYVVWVFFFFFFCCVFCQAEDGIRDLVRSRGLGDVYKRQAIGMVNIIPQDIGRVILNLITNAFYAVSTMTPYPCLLYTSDAADERSSVDLGGRRIIKKKKHKERSDDSNCRNKYQYNKDLTKCT